MQGLTQEEQWILSLVRDLPPRWERLHDPYNLGQMLIELDEEEAMRELRSLANKIKAHVTDMRRREEARIAREEEARAERLKLSKDKKEALRKRPLPSSGVQAPDGSRYNNKALAVANAEKRPPNAQEWRLWRSDNNFEEKVRRVDEADEVHEFDLVYIAKDE